MNPPNETPVVDFKEEEKKATIVDDKGKEVTNTLEEKPDPQDNLLNDNDIELNKEKDFEEDKVFNDDDPIKNIPINTANSPSIDNESAYKKLIENKDKTLQQKEY
jgi:hypothetical protein